MFSGDVFLAVLGLCISRAGFSLEPLLVALVSSIHELVRSIVLAPQNELLFDMHELLWYVCLGVSRGNTMPLRIKRYM